MPKKFMYVNAFGGSINSDRVTKCHVASPLYLSIAQAAYDQLFSKGYFSKDELLRSHCTMNHEHVDLSAMGDVVWPFIIRNLGEKHNVQEVIPLAQTFFKGGRRRLDTTDGEDATVLAGRMIASGHGKKTAGYASYSLVNTRLVVTHLARKNAVFKGTKNAAAKALDYAHETGALGSVSLSIEGMIGD